MEGDFGDGQNGGDFPQILILLAFGFLFSKRGIITESMKNGLSTLLLKAVLPLVILSSSQVAFDGSVLQGFVVTMAVSLVFYVVVVGGLGLVRKRIPIPDGGNRIFVLLCAYGNDGFIGIPLAMQFFGSSGMLYAIAANIVFNITLFSFGIAVLQDKAKPDIKGILLNPCLICTVVALVLYALIRFLMAHRLVGEKGPRSTRPRRIASRAKGLGHRRLLPGNAEMELFHPVFPGFLSRCGHSSSAEQSADFGIPACWSFAVSFDYAADGRIPTV